LHSFPRLALRLLARLPLTLLHALGSVLGWAIYGMSPTYRRHLVENLRLAGYTDARTRREAIAAAGQMLAELPAIWLRTRAELWRWVERVDGGELLRAAHAAGKDIVFLAPHHGCFEITPQLLADYSPVTILYRAPKLRFLQPLMQEGRARDNVRLASADLGGVRELLATLRRHEPVGILPDQVPGEGEGEWAEFFGRPAYTMTLAGKLARRPNTATFLAFGERLPRGAGYVIHLRELAEPLAGETPARHVNRAIEALVRERPGQYLWGYNRYKSPARAKSRPG
jgi:KDO2-lipid IV(A) lauroyltransferase